MALTQIGETRHTSRPETASENLQRLALVAGKDDKSTSQIIRCTRVDRDFSNGKLVLKREELMLQRRREREDQHYKQIWTKGAHGGPYRKVHPLQNMMLTLNFNSNPYLPSSLSSLQPAWLL